MFILQRDKQHRGNKLGNDAVKLVKNLYVSVFYDLLIFLDVYVYC